MPKPRFQMWMIAGLLALAAIALYWPVTGYDFVNYDDPVYFTDLKTMGVFSGKDRRFQIPQIVNSLTNASWGSVGFSGAFPPGCLGAILGHARSANSLCSSGPRTNTDRPDSVSPG